MRCQRTLDVILAVVAVCGFLDEAQGAGVFGVHNVTTLPH